MGKYQLKNKWASNKNLANFRRSVRVLSETDKKKIGTIVVVQIFLSLLDLIGVAVIGLLAALSFNGVQSRQPGSRVDHLLRIIHLQNDSFQFQAAVLALTATIFLVGRTMLSVIFTKRILFYLGRSAALISTSLVKKLLSQPLLAIQQKSTQETSYALTAGVGAITMSVIATTVNLIADIALLTVLFTGLLVVNFSVAGTTIITFLSIGFILHRVMNTNARRLGERQAALIIESNEAILEVLTTYREAFTKDRRHYYSTEFGNLRLSLANSASQSAFLPYVSKYIIETATIVGALLISAAQFLMLDAGHAIATLSIFLAAGSRIAPSVLRVQQGLITIISGLGSAEPTLDLIDQLEHVPVTQANVNYLDFTHPGFISDIKINDVNFSYSKDSSWNLKNINLELGHGKTMALVGPSGSGKTTIVDILLGVLDPNRGEVQISGHKPIEVIRKWPGSLGYVPQDVVIINGTIRENITLGFNEGEIDDLQIRKALEISQLHEFVNTLPLGLETVVGENGSKLSGGQRQRLGIARALATSPKLIVLDEATSALDGALESDISAAISNLRGFVTVVMIAHRLSTVRDADLVVYVENGEIRQSGTFEFVRRSVPDFDHQAKLMGI